MTAPNRRGDGSISSDADSTILAEFDWASVAPSTAVVETVSIATDTDPATIEPLYESVDPDALDEFIRSHGTSSIDSDTTASFTFAGYTVSIRSNGTVVVCPTEEDW